MKSSAAFGICAALIVTGLFGLACGLSAADTNALVKGAIRSAADYNTPDSLSGGIQEAIDSLPAGGGTLSANFERFRRDDPGNRDRGREYAWMPKMRPPWVWPMRYGTLNFADVE